MDRSFSMFVASIRVNAIDLLSMVKAGLTNIEVMVVGRTPFITTVHSLESKVINTFVSNLEPTFALLAIKASKPAVLHDAPIRKKDAIKNKK